MKHFEEEKSIKSKNMKNNFLDDTEVTEEHDE